MRDEQESARTTPTRAPRARGLGLSARIGDRVGTMLVVLTLCLGCSADPAGVESDGAGASAGDSSGGAGGAGAAGASSAGGIGGAGGSSAGGAGGAGASGAGGSGLPSGCPAPLPAGLAYCEDFEDGDELDTFGSNYQEYHEIFLGSTEVISVDCHESSFCLRGNLGNDGTPDAITGEPGTVNPHANVGLGDVAYGSTNDFDLTSLNSDEIAISWWVRFDPGALSNLASGKNHKMLYTDNTQAADYVIVGTSAGGGLWVVVNGDNDSGYPYTAGDNPANQYQYGYDLNPNDVVLDDGAWHHLVIWMQYGSPQQHDGSIRFWLDEVLVLDVDDAWLIYFPGEVMANFALPSNWNALGTEMSTLGWQIDDIQIWDRDPTL